MKPVRVLQVVTYMGRGGLETMIMNYYRHIDRNKLQFDFLVHREFEADYDKEIENLGGRIYRLPRLNPFDKKYLRQLDCFFKEHKDEYQIVHSHLDCMAGIPLKYAAKHGIPIRIAHAHNSNQTKDKKYILKLWYKRNIPQYAAELFACSKDAGTWMYGNKKFQILNNAIDSCMYQYDKTLAEEKRKELSIAEDALVVGHVGRFAPQKNHAFLIEIFAEVLKLQSNTILLLVGDGELFEEIKRKVSELHIEKKVVFLGVRSDIPELLQVMDVFLFPSNFEGLPVSIVEAQAAGIPCLISDKVPIECKKTKLVEQVSLEKSEEEWAKRVLEASKTKKYNTSEEIKQAGFDIIENVKQLQSFYLNSVK